MSYSYHLLLTWYTLSIITLLSHYPIYNSLLHIYISFPYTSLLISFPTTPFLWTSHYIISVLPPNISVLYHLTPPIPCTTILHEPPTTVYHCLSIILPSLYHLPSSIPCISRNLPLYHICLSFSLPLISYPCTSIHSLIHLTPSDPLLLPITYSLFTTL